MVLTVIGAIWVLILIIFFTLGFGDSFSILYNPSIIISLIYWILCYSSSYRCPKSIRQWGFRPSYLCLIGLVVVNIQFFADYAFGLSDLPDHLYPGFSNYADKCFFGGLVFINVFVISNYVSYHNFKLIKTHATDCSTDKIWLVLYLISFVIFLYNINIPQFLSGEIYLGSGSSDFNAGISTSMESIFGTFIIILTAIYTKRLLSKNQKVSISQFFKAFPLLFWIPFLSYLLLRLLSGDRGPVLYNGLLIFYSFSLCTKKLINVKWAFPMIIGLAFIVTLLGVIRSRDTTLSYTEKIEASIQRYGEIEGVRSATISPPTRELANSIRCNYIAVKDIEEGQTDLKYGKYIFLKCISSFPGAKKAYYKPLGLSAEDFSSAEYFTQSWNHGSNYSFGVGSSAFGEAYLDLNIFGVIIIALVLGWLFKMVDLGFTINIDLISLPILIVLFRVSMQSFYIARSSFSILLGSIIYTLIVFYVINFFIKRFRFLR